MSAGSCYQQKAGPLAAGGIRPSATLSKEERLRKRHQFEQVYTRGRKTKGPRLIIFVLPNQLKLNRLGLSITKKRIKLSTRRHYLARLLREVYRLNKYRLCPGCDIVISTANLDNKELGLGSLEKEFLAVAQKAGILKDNLN